jgi:hypothetical protein
LCLDLDRYLVWSVWAACGLLLALLARQGLQLVVACAPAWCAGS